jgi:hypothetical protein
LACGLPIPHLGMWSASLKFFQGESNLAPTNQKRVAELKKRIEFAQIKNFDCTESQEELNALLEERKQNEVLTRLPLYSCKITGYRYVCSTCFDKCYSDNYIITNNNKQK